MSIINNWLSLCENRGGSFRSQWCCLLLVTPLIACFDGTDPARAQLLDRNDHASDFKPGLMASYGPANAFISPVVSRIESKPSFLLQAHQTPHPVLKTPLWHGQWRGMLQVLRTGQYRFTAMLIGNVQVQIGGQQVLQASNNQTAVEVQGEVVTLQGGMLPVLIEYEKTAPIAQLDLMWESSFFTQEPIASQFLFHKTETDKSVVQQTRLHDMGRFYFSEFSCVACHRESSTEEQVLDSEKRIGPDLSSIGNRVFRSWIYHWLGNPQRFRKQAVMPRLFEHSRSGEIERYAVASYLSSLGGPLPQISISESSEEKKKQVDQGRLIFEQIGCIACHRESQGRGVIAELMSLSVKTDEVSLGKYLMDPLLTDPSGRMPKMGLSLQESQAMAAYLCASKDRASEWEFPEIPADNEIARELDSLDFSVDEKAALGDHSSQERLVKMGERLVVQRGCVQCHRIAPGGDKVQSEHPVYSSLVEVVESAGSEKGCLSSDAVKVPKFPFRANQLNAITAYLNTISVIPIANSPAVQVQYAFQQFHCLACHDQNGNGGLDIEQIELLRQGASSLDSEAIVPPPLSGIGSKLQLTWLNDVLAKERRARPWMGLRMPHFGAANVEELPASLAAMDAEFPKDSKPDFMFDKDTVDRGRFLVGTGAFGCIGCHDIAHRPSSGTRGPDLASMNNRVRYQWYKRWLFDPQRMQPGTRMPTVFPNGKSPLADVLGGDGEQQARAIWQYLSLGNNLPLPEGLSVSGGLTVVPGADPAIVRTFMPEIGNRALAVGYPSGVSFAFDAERCRLSYGWTGDFLDVGPAWQGRGGRPARLLGARFWTAPEGFPWSFVPDLDSPLPDWDRQANDIRFGATVPADQGLVRKSRLLRFSGYSLNELRMPELRYEVTSGNSNRISVTEQFLPLQSFAGVGLHRTFQLEASEGFSGWFLIAKSDDRPEISGNVPENVSTKKEKEQRASAEQRDDTEGGIRRHAIPESHLMVKQKSQIVSIISPLQVPDQSQWVIQRQSDHWCLLLEVTSRSGDPIKIELAIWTPFRNDVEILDAIKGHFTK